MNNESSSIPVYIRLFERQGTPTEVLVNKIQALAADSGVLEDVSLEQILQRDSNPSQNRLIYVIYTKPARQRHSVAVGAFLEQLFTQFFDNHPSYVEPLATTNHETATRTT